MDWHVTFIKCGVGSGEVHILPKSCTAPGVQPPDSVRIGSGNLSAVVRLPDPTDERVGESGFGDT
jgi:hypothetical protein